ncbi:hypothetical protein BpHYR1_035839 [Brachionus plicatilis]|uniref:Uncharacterized protein n=1 Tax=Brachionus plicatilis TaxID=10195 RepID=A0A3M7PR76_BRAPC|nr:hypothetical protein BpHYR1_035839 [Brachionus plicatilis]
MVNYLNQNMTNKTFRRIHVKYRKNQNLLFISTYDNIFIKKSLVNFKYKSNKNSSFIDKQKLKKR